MRFDILVLAVLTVGRVALAVAADPAPAQPERTATPAAVAADSTSPATDATTAAPVPPATSATQPAARKAPVSAEEQRLLNQGYKPEMRNGEKIYCRREAETGSRVLSVQHCGTVAQLTTATQDGKDYTGKTQRTQISPTIK
ncbi:MAG TPA: hypothetical protein VEH54_01945 [Steroidobacteraceae bacterium]|nr:hypothetical protein [Steroidobacteraceae bacterium]